MQPAVVDKRRSFRQDILSDFASVDKASYNKAEKA